MSGPGTFETMNTMLSSGADEQVQEYIDLLYNQALLLEGSKLKDPAGFARSVAKLMAGSSLPPPIQQPKGEAAQQPVGHSGGSEEDRHPSTRRDQRHPNHRLRHQGPLSAAERLV